MRTSIAFAGILAALLARGAAADDVPATSKVDAVTVFLSGAEVTRAARLSIEKGDHTIVFNDLPAETVANSIRVDGKATAKLDIESVDTQRRFIPRADQAALQAERKSLEDEIEKLNDDRTLAQGQAEAAEKQKALLGNLAELPAHSEDQPGHPVPQTDWAQLLSLIASGMTEAQKNALDAQVKIRDLDRKIEELKNKLSALAPARTEQTEVRVHVVAAAPLEADLTVRYQVRNAAWTPGYDARLATGSKTSPPRLDLTRRAEIRQHTGESWDDVALQLSTTRPTADAAAPQLQTVTVDFEEPAKPSASMAPAPQAASGEHKARNLAVRQKKLDGDQIGAGIVADEAAPAPPPEEIGEQSATVAAAPFQAIFAVPNRLTIPDTGESKRVLLQQDSIEPVLTVRAVPKVDTKAYLYAKLVLPKGSPALPGTVALFRDGTFVGTGTLPVLSPGEDHELGFGADDQVRVRHAISEEKQGETGLISSAKTDSRNFRITIKNMHERAVQLVVHDQIPVSQNEDIKVDLVGPAAPTKKDIEDRRGVISFESKLEPEEEKVIEFGYRVIWPGSRQIIYR
jgi:uncharacterized protein (TIGR02231 family)